MSHQLLQIIKLERGGCVDQAGPTTPRPTPPPSTLPLACLYPHTDPPYRTALRRPLKNERCGALGARQTLTCGREGWDVEQGGDRSPALPATALQSPEIWSITIVQG